MKGQLYLKLKLSFQCIIIFMYMQMPNYIDYLGYENYDQESCREDVEKTTKHGSVCIQVVAEQYSAHDHDENDDRREIDDDSNVLGIIENLDLDIPCLKGQYNGNQLCQKNVQVEYNDPD